MCYYIVLISLASTSYYVAPTADFLVSVVYSLLLTHFIRAKCNVNQLREVILKYKPSALPAEDADVETHVTQALDSYWSINNGDWPGLIKNIEVIHYLTHQPFALPDRLTDPKDDLLKHADDQSKYIKQAVDLTNLLSQERIISLIIEYGDKSYLPKLNRNKHEGKFLKGDYIAGIQLPAHSPTPFSRSRTSRRSVPGYHEGTQW